MSPQAQNRSMTKALLAAAAGTALVFGVAACGDADNGHNAADHARSAGEHVKEAGGHAAEAAKDAAGNVKDGAKDAAGNAKDAAGNVMDGAKDAAGNVKDGAVAAKDKAGEKASDAREAVTGKSPAEMVEVKDATGANVDIPNDIKTAWDNAGGANGSFGAIQEVVEDGGNYLVTFKKGHMVYSEKYGANPVIGKIAETWVSRGGLQSELGLPTAPERGTARTGWTQSFENGQIEWKRGDNGRFGSNIVMF